jgi:hypothetical protein
MSQRSNHTSQRSKPLVKKNRLIEKKREKDLELSLIRTYPKQVVWQTWLPATPVKATTTVTSGIINLAYPISISEINSFATRFENTFVEYRIIRARFRIRLFSSINPGVIQFWIDEKSAAVPTAAEAAERYVLSISASATDTSPVLKWISADPLDLQYQAIGTAVTLATFKAYTSLGNFGSSAVATDYFEIVPEFEFQFRGLLGV